MKITVGSSNNDPKDVDDIFCDDDWNEEDVVIVDQSEYDKMSYNPDEDIFYGPFDTIEELWRSLMDDED